MHIHDILDTSEGPIRRTREGESEWEPIKILLEGDGNSNKMRTASNTRLRLTTKVGQAHVATGVPLDLGTNTQPSDPRKAAEHLTSSLQTHTGQTGETHRSDRLQPESPQGTKQANRPPNWPKLETAATRDNNEHTRTFTRAKTHQGSHRSDRSRAPVRPV
jgi:hypothetical protein